MPGSSRSTPHFWHHAAPQDVLDHKLGTSDGRIRPLPIKADSNASGTLPPGPFGSRPLTVSTRPYVWGTFIAILVARYSEGADPRVMRKTFLFLLHIFIFATVCYLIHIHQNNVG